MCIRDSYYSDGMFSPSEVVRLADEAGCDLFALTDHDTTDGLNEAQKTADKLSIDTKLIRKNKIITLKIFIN